MTVLVGVVAVGWLVAAFVVYAACDVLDGHLRSTRVAELRTRQLRAAGMPGRFTADPLLDDDAAIVAVAVWIVAARVPVPLRGRLLLLLATTPIGSNRRRQDDQ